MCKLAFFNIKKYRLLSFLFLGFLFVRGEERVRDIVIYGGTSAGITAAVQAKKMGNSVVVVSPDIHLGGLSSSGLGWTDSGKKEAIGGLAREFYHRVWRHYQSVDSWTWQAMEDYGNRGQGTPAIDGAKRTMWIFEPHVSEEIFETWVKEHDLDVIRNEWLDRERGVEISNGVIRAITTLSGNRYEGKMFLDCTYEGDLMAAAGVSYFVGREANSVYGETLSGVQTRSARSHQFKGKIDPFVIEGDPSSGLLARISDQPPGVEGSGDTKMQAYNFRLCLTQVEENRRPFPKPEKYDPLQYELLLRTLLKGSTHVFGKFDPIPNAKTDTNNHGPFSTDNIGMNYAYPEASYDERDRIIAEHETYQKGYFYFLCNDPRVPEEIRSKMSSWGLAKDEFEDQGNWPHQIYVREARRMVSDFVTTEHHLRGLKETPHSVGMGSYTMDSHNVQRYVATDTSGKPYVLNEGDVQVDPGGPYQISYNSLIPKEEECKNLLVPVCLSSSHIAFGSVRMEPVFMILAHSAATAASLAIEDGVIVQRVSYEKLKNKLMDDGQVLALEKNDFIASGHGIDPQTLSGVVVEGEQVNLLGDWTKSSSLRPFVGDGYFHDGNGGKGMRKAEFPFLTDRNGLHELRISYIPSGNRAGKVKYLVEDEKGLEEILVDQRKKGSVEKIWHSLGSFDFLKGKSYKVSLQNDDTEGYVVVDALQIIPLN
jgi:hypothetical protein